MDDNFKDAQKRFVEHLENRIQQGGRVAADLDKTLISLIIADRLHAEGWSYGIAEHFTKHGLLFCVDAYRDGKRFIVRAG